MNRVEEKRSAKKQKAHATTTRVPATTVTACFTLRKGGQLRKRKIKNDETLKPRLFVALTTTSPVRSSFSCI